MNERRVRGHTRSKATGECGANNLQAFEKRLIILGSQSRSLVRIYPRRMLPEQSQ